jgi:hypothetical protein
MDVRHEDGIAMIMAMAATLLMSALGMALVLTTSSETIISANFRDGSEAAYAADAALERSIDDLSRAPDWNAVLTGSAQSAFIDGAPSGMRTLADGSTIDLGHVVNMANCGKVAVCSEADLDAIAPQRPWGTNNPRWQLYAYGKLSDMLPNKRIDSPYYVLVMVGDDSSETDGKPLQDAIDTPGAGVLALRAVALGPRGAQRTIEMTVVRTRAGVRSLSWRDTR